VIICSGSLLILFPVVISTLLSNTFHDEHVMSCHMYNDANQCQFNGPGMLDLREKFPLQKYRKAWTRPREAWERKFVLTESQEISESGYILQPISMQCFIRSTSCLKVLLTSLIPPRTRVPPPLTLDSSSMECLLIQWISRRLSE